MSDVIEEIRCALAMRDAGYAVLFDHETSAELLSRYDGLIKALKRVRSLANNPKHHGNAIAEIYEVATMGVRAAVGTRGESS